MIETETIEDTLNRAAAAIATPDGYRAYLDSVPDETVRDAQNAAKCWIKGYFESLGFPDGVEVCLEYLSVTGDWDANTVETPEWAIEHQNVLIDSGDGTYSPTSARAARIALAEQLAEGVAA